MYLKDILKGIKFRTESDISSIDIKSVADDSRTVKEGSLFIAVKGHAIDGRKFIGEAVKKGAKAIIAEEDFEVCEGAAKIMVGDTRKALPIIADNFYGHPSQKLKVVGVTGTNGKTTITYLMEGILKAAGIESGVIGTINYRLKDRSVPAKNTTPGALELQSMLSEMIRERVDYAVMEVSSHSLDQGRTDRIGFDAAIFTNVTSEHLDYHKTIGNYFTAKTKLFEKLKEDGTAVLNNDDERVASLKGLINRKVLTYAVKADADVMARDIELSIDGSKFRVIAPKGAFSIKTRLIGIHNVSNILAAIAASIALNVDAKTIKKGIESATLVPGRLESVEGGQPFKVLVDYAHTEDALYNILSLVKDVSKGRIITIFGCGGNRDRTKRPCMGKVACKFSNRVFITSDNPRFEEPRAIIDEIVAGIKDEFSNYDIVVDRRKAIEKALRLASKDDIVIIAGKGHEDYQIVKDVKLSFDDRKVALEVLKKG